MAGVHTTATPALLPTTKCGWKAGAYTLPPPPISSSITAQHRAPTISDGAGVSTITTPVPSPSTSQCGSRGDEDTISPPTISPTTFDDTAVPPITAVSSLSSRYGSRRGGHTISPPPAAYFKMIGK